MTGSTTTSKFGIYDNYSDESSGDEIRETLEFSRGDVSNLRGDVKDLSKATSSEAEAERRRQRFLAQRKEHEEREKQRKEHEEREKQLKEREIQLEKEEAAAQVREERWEKEQLAKARVAGKRRFHNLDVSQDEHAARIKHLKTQLEQAIAAQKQADEKSSDASSSQESRGQASSSQLSQSIVAGSGSSSKVSASNRQQSDGGMNQDFLRLCALYEGMEAVGAVLFCDNGSDTRNYFILKMKLTIPNPQRPGTALKNYLKGIGLYARRIQPADVKDKDVKEHYVKSMSQYRFTIPELEEKYTTGMWYDMGIQNDASVLNEPDGLKSVHEGLKELVPSYDKSTMMIYDIKDKSYVK